METIEAEGIIEEITVKNVEMEDVHGMEMEMGTTVRENLDLIRITKRMRMDVKLI